MLKMLHNLLTEYPLGLSEYQLIDALRRAQHPFFVEANLNEPLSLFRTHFVLFNALYQLRDELHKTQNLDLYISALMIRLQANSNNSSAADTAIQAHDPLRAYYLDINHLQETDRSAAHALLYGGLHRINPPVQVEEALNELGIVQPLHSLSKQVLQKHYRQLVSIHHPDRGGCTERLQRINQAMDIIRTHQDRYLSS